MTTTVTTTAAAEQQKKNRVVVPQRKFKGTVNEDTLSRILSEKALERGYNGKTKEITYYTGKNIFVAKRRSTRQFDIFQISGV